MKESNKPLRSEGRPSFTYPSWIFQLKGFSANITIFAFQFSCSPYQPNRREFRPLQVQMFGLSSHAQGAAVLYLKYTIVYIICMRMVIQWTAGASTLTWMYMSSYLYQSPLRLDSVIWHEERTRVIFQQPWKSVTPALDTPGPRFFAAANLSALKWAAGGESFVVGYWKLM